VYDSWVRGNMHGIRRAWKKDMTKRYTGETLGYVVNIGTEYLDWF